MKLIELIKANPEPWQLTERGGEAQIFPWGEWNHPEYGKMTFDEAFFSELMANFSNNVRGKKIPIDSEHMIDPQGAKGYIVALRMVPGVGLFATPEWTEYGLSLLSDDRFKYFSPAFRNEWKHPQTGEIFNNVLTSVAMTVDPFCLGMQEYRLSGSCEQAVTLADAEKTDEKDPLDEKTDEEIVGDWKRYTAKILDKFKGKKGAPMTRGLKDMMNKQIDEMFAAHFKQPQEKPKEDKSMSETMETAVATIDLSAYEAEKKAIAEKLARAEMALAAERESMKALKEQARKDKVMHLTEEMNTKRLIKSGMVDAFSAFAMKLAETDDSTNEIRLSEGKPQVALLNEFKSVMESCVMPIQLHEKELGAATVDETPKPKSEKPLSQVEQIRKFAEDNKIGYNEAVIKMRENGIEIKPLVITPKE